MRLGFLDGVILSVLLLFLLLAVSMGVVDKLGSIITEECDLYGKTKIKNSAYECKKIEDPRRKP